MNTLDLFVLSYKHLLFKNKKFNRLLTPLRVILRLFANIVLPSYLKNNKYGLPKKEIDVIVSLTSFPARINTVWQVIECMKRQTYKPFKVILWLSKNQFSDVQHVPTNLRDRQSDFFEIVLVDGDAKSHKKYYYASKTFPNSLIFLIDDDLYYDTKILERSYKAYHDNPSCIICNLGSLLTFNEDGSHKSFAQWNRKTTKGDYIGEELMFGSGAGTLFKPDMLHEDLLNLDLAIKLAPTADDLWLNAMARLNNTPKCLLPNGAILPIASTQHETLFSQNGNLNQNDVQLANIEKYYGPIFNRL